MGTAWARHAMCESALRWLILWIYFKGLFYLLHVTKLFMKVKSTNIEEMDVEERKADLAFLVFVTRHLNSHNKELHGN